MTEQWLLDQIVMRLEELCLDLTRGYNTRPRGKRGEIVDDALELLAALHLERHANEPAEPPATLHSLIVAMHTWCNQNVNSFEGALVGASVRKMAEDLSRGTPRGGSTACRDCAGKP